MTRALDLSKFEEVPPAGGAALDLSRFEEVGDRPAVSKTESFLRGAGQGLTFGFRDEISGLLESVLTGKDYKTARDEARAADRAAKEDNPWTYGAGELGTSIATSFVPGLGIARAAKLGAVAGRAAVQGGVAGLGASESEDLGGQLTDAATSAALSAGAAGIMGKVVRGAPERVEKRLIGDITDGATATQRDKLVGRAGSKADDVIKAIRQNPEIKAAGGDAHRLLPAVENAVESAGKHLDSLYPKEATIKVMDVQKKLMTVFKELEKDPGKRPMASAVWSQMDDIAAAWGDRTHVTAQDVRVLAKDIGDAAFRGSPAVAPKQGTMVSRQVWGELKDLIGENIESTLGAGARKELAAANRYMSTLLTMRDAVAYRATRGSTTPTTLTSRLGGALDIGLAFTDPTTFVAKKAYDFVGKPAARALDERLANLVVAARNGSTPAQIGQMAIELGVGRAAGEALAQWAMKKAGQIGVSDPVPDGAAY